MPKKTKTQSITVTEFATKALPESWQPGTQPGVEVAVEPPTVDELADMAEADEPKKAPKNPKGPTRTDVMAILLATGLPVQEKSSTHVGNPKGVRVVVPKADVVRRLYMYKADALSSLPGYKSPEMRKTEGLGAVTHVTDVSDISTVRALVEALCQLNGVKLPKMPRQKLSRASGETKASPMVEATTPVVGVAEGIPGPLDPAAVPAPVRRSRKKAVAPAGTPG